ncbi:hypothetical protein WBP07_03170 [Novosphingobium sp. BL-8A]|uniref:hypothetical protein n=1 Tax=Novosphingobium sp. BL-8A TaxID=3127639 RepID=UPI003756F52E
MNAGPCFLRAALAVLACAMLAPATSALAASDESRCAVDRTRLLALDQQAFDQGATGWRELARNGCFTAAADLIRDWRTLNAKSDTILTWHEGQMRANAGDYRRAIALFDQSRKKPDGEMAEAWNIYVDGTLAFLRRDRPGLESARVRLAGTSKPLEFHPFDGNGKPLAVTWPPNLAVLDSLLRCWDATYLRAYSCPASP